jgi:hypothetical protein
VDGARTWTRRGALGTLDERTSVVFAWTPFLREWREMNTDKQTDKTELVYERPQGTNQLAGGPRYRYGKKRVPGCRCTYNFTCGPCLNASGPTK